MPLYRNTKPLVLGLKDVKRIHEGFDNLWSRTRFNRLRAEPGHLANFVCLVVKHYIYRTRCFKEKPAIQALKAYVEEMRKIELYNAKQQGNVYYYNRKWWGIDCPYNSANDVEDYIMEYIANPEDAGSNTALFTNA